MKFGSWTVFFITKIRLFPKIPLKAPYNQSALIPYKGG
jgi:hypothetical protein